ncbi:MAG: tetratricopeptide repeat protein [Chloroflexia bacterium]
MDQTLTFGAWIKRRRRALDITQQGLAGFVGCSVSAIVKIEAGRRRPSLQIAELLMSCLQIPEEEQAGFLELARVSPDEGDPGAYGTPTNLPAPLTSLVGRQDEIDQVRDLLLDGARILTLIGPGGIGKTRLGIEIASGLLGAFRDGVFFVALAPISDPALVPSTIAKTLGVRESASESLVDDLKRHLGNKRMLVVLDNFEQVAGAAPLLADLLSSAPRARILVTSRTRLHIYGEQQYVVPPLSIPSIEDPTPAEELSRYDAVRLFVERARLVKPDFALGTGTQAGAVAAICRRLDGMPLAIELAAARANVVSPLQMLERLESPLDLLAGGPMDLPPRQQTLRGAIGWSYGLLDPAEKALFRGLSVFVGGCTVRSAEAVCNRRGDLGLAVVDGIQSLLGKSLLHEYEGTSNEPRFRMLEILREYAAEALAEEEGESAELLARRRDYYLALVEEAEPELAGAEQAAWLARLDDEHDNLRAVLQLALGQDDVEAALRMAGALWRFWLVRGYYSEGREYLSMALKASEPDAAPGGQVHSILAKALNGAGILAWRQNDYSTAHALSEEALGINRELEDGQGVAQALNNLGNIAHSQGDYERAQSLFEESLEVRRGLGDKRGIADSLNNLALVVDEQGDYNRARRLYEESLAARREVGDRRGIANSLNNLALVDWEHGELDRARMLLEESLGMYRELGDKRGIANSLNNIGLVAWEQKDYEAARSLYVESIQRYRDLEDTRGIIDCLDGLARVSGSQGDAGRAARLWGAAEALRESIGVSIPPGDLPEYERIVAASRAELDEPGWNAAWSAGRIMPVERAVAFALEGDIQPSRA